MLVYFFLIKNSQAFDNMASSLERREKERKISEERLRESERKYRELANLLPGVVFETDELGNITFTNQMAFELFGYNEDDLSGGLNIFKLVLPADCERARAAFLRALNSEKSSDEFILRRKDGSTFSAIIQASPIIREGRAVGIRGVVVDITERKRAEEELQTAFSELSGIYKNVPLLMLLLDQERRVKKVNDAVIQFTGQSFEEVKLMRIGEVLRCIHSLEDPKGCGFGPLCNECVIRKVVLDIYIYHRIQFGVEAAFPLLIQEKEEERWFLINTSPVSIGDRINVLICLQDITRLKTIERELRENLETLRAFINSNPETSLLLDGNGRVLLANETFSKRLGRAMEEVIGSCLYDLFPEGISKRRKDKIEEVFKTGRAIRFEDHRSGRDYETFIYPIFDTEGKVRNVSILGIDITERRKMQEDLRRSEERFKKLFNEAPVGYHEYDMDGRITEVNQTELEMLGYSREEMIGHHVWEFVVEEISEETVRGKLSGNIPAEKSFERTFRKKDGTFLPVLITDKSLRDSGGRLIGIRSALQDISKLKEIEKERKALEEQLRQSQKMEAIGRLAGGIAHDFNNLLTVIKGYSQLSLLGLNMNDPLRESLKEIERSAERASNLIRQLLAFSRKQIMEMKVLNLNFIIHDLEKMLRRIIGEDIEFITHLSENLWNVKTDPGQIEQVIINLVVNARDAMPEGGKITIKTENVVLDEEYAGGHMEVVPGNYVMLSISDTGCGMTKEVMERIFEPFFTTKERGKGTGLGLSVVYGIVKQSGGNIWVYSEPGQGTIFKIYLPKVEEEGKELQRKGNKEDVPRGNETILVVEDDDSVRKLAVRFLKRQGYITLESRGGQEALEIFKAHCNTINLILIDVVMPELSGPEMVEKLRLISQNFKVLYMSGYTDNGIINNFVINEGIGFIAKPFTFEGLLKKIREVLDNK